jgi:hypothetical protein
MLRYLKMRRLRRSWSAYADRLVRVEDRPRQHLWAARVSAEFHLDSVCMRAGWRFWP